MLINIGIYTGPEVNTIKTKNLADLWLKIRKKLFNFPMTAFVPELHIKFH